MCNKVRISHSAITTLNACPRKILFKDKMRLFPNYGSIAMRYGSAFHVGMEAYYKNDKSLIHALEAAADYWKKPTPQLFQEDYRNLESLLTAITEYDARFRGDCEEVSITPENKVVTTISLTDEEKKLYGDFAVDFVTVVDLILEIDKMQWVIDFKTTSVELSFMASRLRKMVQLMGYQFVTQANYGSVNGCMVYYHQLKASKSRKTGLYGDVTIDFLKCPMIFSDKDYEDWRRYVIWNAFKLDKVEAAGYPPDFNHCYDFNKACEYMPLCSYPKWDLDKFLEMDGFYIIPDERKIIEVVE